jgi:hypothetical protein
MVGLWSSFLLYKFIKHHFQLFYKYSFFEDTSSVKDCCGNDTHSDTLSINSLTPWLQTIVSLFYLYHMYSCIKALLGSIEAL